MCGIGIADGNNGSGKYAMHINRVNFTRHRKNTMSIRKSKILYTYI